MYLNTFVDTAGYLVFSSTDGLSWTQESDLIFPGIATGGEVYTGRLKIE